MIGFKKVPLKKLISQIGEDRAKAILSDFSCPMNIDIERFLNKKAIDFEKHGWSATHLIFASYKNEPVLVGYYALSNKSLILENQAISRTLKKRLNQFASYNPELKAYIISAPLIAQLGKNFNKNYNNLISGDELLKIAIEDVMLIQQILGGKVVYIECEDNPKIIDFYSSNGFVAFDKRKLDPDETDVKGDYLIQMLKYFK